LLGQRNVLAASENADSWVQSQAARIVPCIPATDADLVAAAAQLGLVPTA
jgi:hypothetical protein